MVGVVEATGCDDPVWLNCQHRPLVTVGCSAAFGAVIWPFTLAVGADAACVLVLLLGIGLMAAGLLFDTSVRSRNRGAGRTSDKHHTSRLPLVLFWILLYGWCSRPSSSRPGRVFR